MSSPTRSKTWRRLQAARHIVMGLILIALGYAVVHYHKFGTIELDPTTTYVLAAIMGLYGLFRIWRGTLDLRVKDPEDYVT